MTFHPSCQQGSVLGDDDGGGWWVGGRGQGTGGGARLAAGAAGAGPPDLDLSGTGGVGSWCGTTPQDVAFRPRRHQIHQFVWYRSRLSCPLPQCWTVPLCLQ